MARGGLPRVGRLRVRRQIVKRLVLAWASEPITENESKGAGRRVALADKVAMDRTHEEHNVAKYLHVMYRDPRAFLESRYGPHTSVTDIEWVEECDAQTKNT